MLGHDEFLQKAKEGTTKLDSGHLQFAMKIGWIEKTVTVGYLVNPGPEFSPNVNLNIVPDYKM
jgi:hypothetical protein